MVVNVQIVPFVGVCQLLGVSILVLVSKRFLWEVVFVRVCVIYVDRWNVYGIM